MEKIKKLAAACILIAGILTSTGGNMKVFAASAEMEIQPFLIWGTVADDEDNRIEVIRQDPGSLNQEIIINIDKNSTRVLDAVTGNPVPPDNIEEGSLVYAYVGPAMTLSIPPMTTAELILTNIPADFKVPDYITVESMTFQPEGAEAILTAAGGTQYRVPADTPIFPYLTRNIITLSDLKKGRTALVWTEPNSNTVVKIMLFPGLPDEEISPEEDMAPSQTGWVKRGDTWYYLNPDGELHTGWLNDNGSWYYLDPATGRMATGFLTLGNNTYYLQEDGRMLTTPRTFTPDRNGVLH